MLSELDFHKYAIGPVQELMQPSPGATKPEMRLLRGGYSPGWAFQRKELTEELKKIVPEKTINRLQTHGYLQLQNPNAYREQIDNWNMPNGKPMPEWIKNINRRGVDKVTPEMQRMTKRHELVHYLRRKEVFGDTPRSLSIPQRIKEEAIAYWHQRPKANRFRRALDVITSVPSSTIVGHLASKRILKSLGR